MSGNRTVERAFDTADLSGCSGSRWQVMGWSLAGADRAADWNGQLYHPISQCFGKPNWVFGVVISGLVLVGETPLQAGYGR